MSCNMIPCTCGMCFPCDICQRKGRHDKPAHDAYQRGIAEGVRQEREAVVKWLNAKADGVKQTHSYPEANAANMAERDTWQAAADDVNDGDHAKEQP